MKQVQSFVLSIILLLSCLYIHVDVLAEEEQDQITEQEQSSEEQSQTTVHEQPE